MLKGKQGRFRQNLLGKRVDYSGRSVIVVGPELKLHQCGLPKEMALELFKPFVMKKLVDSGIAHNIKAAKRMVEKNMNQVWDILEEVITDHPVLLNRAPTLHRLGIQAFQPVLVEGRAIKLHPLVCTAYNADFDGDQMAVHVPLSMEAQAEARFLMLAAVNILKPSDGKPVCVPSQDMILGSYYLTMENAALDSENMKSYSNSEEAIMAFELGYLNIHEKIKLKVTKEINGERKTKLIETTVGKVIFNESIPQDLGFVDRSKEENLFKFEIDFLVNKGKLTEIVDRCYLKYGSSETALMLDQIKTKGYHYSTIGAITVAASDMIVPKEKESIIKESEEKVELISKKFRRGLMTEDERYNSVIEIWNKTTDKIADVLMNSMGKFNPISMMADSGARGSKSQIKQLAGMRGLMSNPSGKIIELPIKASFREGLDVLEYFTSTHGARKGNADTALKTADSGYLTRRLVDVSQDVIVRSEDCGTEEGIYVSEIKDDNSIVESLTERLIGRYAAEDVIDPVTKEVIINKGDYITNDIAKYVGNINEDEERTNNQKILKVKIRSVFTCDSRIGVCSKCYGMNMATAREINIGESVGIIAAQSIGEPGTQLTMRTFHTGGVAGADITQGLPRVEELFEARKPKGLAIVSEISGIVEFENSKKKRLVRVISDDGEVKEYDIPFGSRVKVENGMYIEAGSIITEGSINPQDILRIKGIDAVREYLLAEVQKVYRLQGVDINDKHLEVIIKQMTRKVRILEAGDTEILPNSIVDISYFNDENKKVREMGGKEAECERVLLGITKASLATESFLSAASFQETTKVLTDAAIKGKIDPLVGLKENVIIGKLIPAGTGMVKYRSMKIMYGEDDNNLEYVTT